MVTIVLVYAHELLYIIKLIVGHSRMQHISFRKLKLSKVMQ